MTILHRDEILELIERKDLIIESTDERVPFDPEAQIKSDTIDLRLHPKGLVYKRGLELVDTLTQNPAELFEVIAIPPTGYVLKPGHILFGSALEVVCLTNGEYMGRFSNRGTFSRFGISVTCGKMRFPAGAPGTPDLQIVNHASLPVKIYPYSFVVQLQVETMKGTPDPYDGVYPKSIGPVPPVISTRDRNVAELLSEVAALSESPFPDPRSSARIANKIDTSLRMERKPPIQIVMSRRLQSFLSLAAGVLATLVGGFLVNMISQGEWSYWKYVSAGFAALLALILLVLGILSILGSEQE